MWASPCATQAVLTIEQVCRSRRLSHEARALHLWVAKEFVPHSAGAWNCRPALLLQKPHRVKPTSNVLAVAEQLWHALVPVESAPVGDAQRGMGELLLGDLRPRLVL